MSPSNKKAGKKPAKKSARKKSPAKKAVKRAVKKSTAKKTVSAKAVKKSKAKSSKTTRKAPSKASAKTSGGPSLSSGSGGSLPTGRGILFRASLRDPMLGSPANAEYAIQFYDATSDTWEQLTPNAASDSGEYWDFLDLSTEAIENDPLATMVDAILEAGGFPAFRLVVADTMDSEVVGIISHTWQVSHDSTTEQFICDFGFLWLLDAPIQSTTSDGTAVITEELDALCIPAKETEAFYALWGAVSQPKNLIGFDPAKYDIQIVLKGESPGRSTASALGSTARQASTTSGESYPTGKGILFKAALLDSIGQIPDDKEYRIEYYDSSNEEWGQLTEAKSSTDGKFWDFLDLSEEAVENDPLAAMVDAILTAGSFLSFRMVVPGVTTSDPTGIISHTWQLSADAVTSQYTCDFGALWLLAYPIQGMTYEGVPVTTEQLNALRIPVKGSLAFDSLWGAVAQTINFKGFDPSTYDVKLVAKGGSLCNCDAEIIAILQNQIDLLIAQLEFVTAENESLQRVVSRKADENVTLTDDLADAREEIGDLKRTINLDGGESTTIEEVYTHIVGEVKSASEALTTSGYKLDNMSFNLKTFAENDAAGNLKVKLVNVAMAQTSKGEAVSNLVFDIVANTASATLFNESVMPNLQGLTETLTRKKLQTYGLRLKAVYQITQDPGISVGQAFRQFPAAGEPITVGDEVTVIFSKE